MAKDKQNKPEYTRTLIRTVSHYSDDEYESESLLHVNTNIYKNSDSKFNYEHVSVEDPNGEYQFIHIHSEAQAIELFRAIKSAGKELGWFEND